MNTFVSPRPPIRSRVRTWLHRHLFVMILWLCAAGLVLVAAGIAAGW